MVKDALTTSSGRVPRIALVGAAHVDRIATIRGAYQPGYSNPGRLFERVGGASFNAALAVRAFGAGAHLVSACGGDPTAEQVGLELEQAGIHDARITWLDRRSATYTAMLDGEGDLICGVADMDIYDILLPRTLSRRHLKDLIASSDGLLIDANLPAPALRHLAGFGTNLPVAAIAVSPAKAPRLADALAGLSLLFASRVEVSSLLGLAPGPTDAELHAAIRAAGLRRAVVTDGPRPVLVVDGLEAFRQAPPPVTRIVDVIGAGDTLAGVAFAATLSGRSFPQAVRIGLVAASLRIGGGLDSTSAHEAEDIANALPAPQPIPA